MLFVIPGLSLLAMGITSFLGNYGSVVGPEESEAGPFPSLRDYFRAVLAVQGALCRAEKRRALDRSGPL